MDSLGEDLVSFQPADEQEIAAIESSWGHQFPPEHRRFLLTRGGFDGPLIDPSGAEVVDQFRLHSVAQIVEDHEGYDIFADEPALLPIGGADAWRYCLRARADGQIDYIDLDLGSGDVLDECGSTLSELIAFVLAEHS